MFVTLCGTGITWVDEWDEESISQERLRPKWARKAPTSTAIPVDKESVNAGHVGIVAQPFPARHNQHFRNTPERRGPKNPSFRRSGAAKQFGKSARGLKMLKLSQTTPSANWPLFRGENDKKRSDCDNDQDFPLNFLALSLSALTLSEVMLALQLAKSVIAWAQHEPREQASLVAFQQRPFMGRIHWFACARPIVLKLWGCWQRFTDTTHIWGSDTSSCVRLREWHNTECSLHNQPPPGVWGLQGTLLQLGSDNMLVSPTNFHLRRACTQSCSLSQHIFSSSCICHLGLQGLKTSFAD